MWWQCPTWTALTSYRKACNPANSVKSPEALRGIAVTTTPCLARSLIIVAQT